MRNILESKILIHYCIPGSAGGGGAAWLLINHKQQLGVRKAPMSLITWTTPGTDENGDEENWYHMVFQFST